MKSKDDQKAILNDYKCLIAIRMAVKNKTGELKVYKKVTTMLTELIQEANSNKTLRKTESIKGLDEYDQERYKEDLFSTEDFLFYRGIAEFYSKNYKAAINDFEESIIAKRESEALTMPKNESITDNPYDSIDTDLSDVGLCAVNVNEYNFNIILSYIMVIFLFI